MDYISGFIGFSDCVGDHAWYDEEKKLLVTMAKLMDTSAIKKTIADELLQLVANTSL